VVNTVPTSETPQLYQNVIQLDDNAMVKQY
jgi:hypothetical protein